MSRQRMEQYYIGHDQQSRRIVPHTSQGRQRGFSMQSRMITVTPDAIIPSANEPIEAGSIRSRRSEADEPLSSRRSSVTWETMTDDERDEVQRLKRKEEAFKTALCDAYKKYAECPYGEACRFAHGENELRLPAQPRGKAHPKYKTQLCDKFSSFGHCPYGPRCQFIHKLKKGLPLMQYERLISNGQISPEREDEVNTAQNIKHQPGDSPMNRPRMDNYPTRRLSFGARVFTPKENLKDPVYPKMEVINIERAWKNADEVHNERCVQRRRASRSEYDEMRAAADKGLSQMGRSASMQSLAFRGSPCDQQTSNCDSRVSGLNEVRNGLKNRKIMDLSLITEEPEETQNLDISPRSSRNKRSHWSEMIFGKKMETISEDDKDHPEEKNLTGRTNEAELLVQSCDEELLAQGLYDYRYPDTPTDLLEQWKYMRGSTKEVPIEM